ncbi:hypothetical protein FA15DRAFT_710800 [Coprinopsis marcescibilis]|uniref:Uncharacterized protein n=1 Tax=Coprinopsis marcescibilis TaxID=230819 RepID=A0A5C3KBH3_COPMA|nr:hypothetical protein FA15DRAFT_710800 [Coprinopsis marcescibilis]
MFFTGKIYVHHSAIARFFAPSDVCGSGGMHRQTIRCNPKWEGGGRFDMVIMHDRAGEEAVLGPKVAQLYLIFSFTDTTTEIEHHCALISMFPVDGDSDMKDPATGMWIVKRQEDGEDKPLPLQIVLLSEILRGAHLIPVYGTGYLPQDFSHVDALDSFYQYYVNPYVDNHTHEYLSRYDP